MEQHNGTTYENVWGVTFGDRLEEAREEARTEGKAEGREEGKAEGRKEGKVAGIRKKEKQFITQMIRMGFDDKTIQTAVEIRDVNEIKKIRKRIMS